MLIENFGKAAEIEFPCGLIVRPRLFGIAAILSCRPSVNIARMLQRHVILATAMPGIPVNRKAGSRPAFLGLRLFAFIGTLPWQVDA